MDSFSHFSQFQKRKINPSFFACPVCHEECSIYDLRCKTCNEDLLPYVRVLCAKYPYFNQAIEIAESDSIFALEKISEYLSFHPDDSDAKHLRYFLEYRISGEKILPRLSALADQENDRWLAEFASNPSGITVSSFVKRKIPEGLGTISLSQLAFQSEEERKRFLPPLVDLINTLFSLNFFSDTADKKIISLRDHSLIPFFRVFDVTVTWDFGVKFDENIGSERFIHVYKEPSSKDKKEMILSVYQPEIVYKGTILQRAAIGVGAGTETPKL